MKKGRAVMWVSVKTASAVLIALGLFAACGQTNERESGETHFLLSCSGETCGAGLQCLCGVCSKACESDAECGAFGGSVTCVEHDGAACKTVTKSCDATCSKDADCATVSPRHSCEAGLCRVADTTTPTPGNPCEGGCGNSSCSIQGGCLLTTTCDLVGCGSAAIDENACYRPLCEQDTDCDADQRCTAVYRTNRIDCVDDGAGSSCSCTSGHGLFPINVCSPVALAGPRGTWQSISVNENVIGDETDWTITPDGTVTKTLGQQAGGGTTTAQLSMSDKDELIRLISGPELRLVLTDPQPCPITKSRDDVVKLELDSETLEKNVAGCLSTVGAFDSLLDLVSRY